MVNKSKSLAIVAALAALTGCDAIDANSPSDDGWIVDDDVSRGSAPTGPTAFTPPPPARLNGLIQADHPPPPISGGTLAVTADGALAVAADPDRDTVYVVDLAAGGTRTISFPQGSEPGRVVLDASRRAHVVLRNRGALAHVDLESGSLIAETTVCQLPRGLAYDAEQDGLWVACASGELVAVSARSRAELSRTFVALDLRDVIISKSGDRFVSRYRSAELIGVAADGTIQAPTAPLPLSASRFEVLEEQTVQLSGGGFASSGSAGTRQVTMSPTLAWRTVLAPDGAPLMLHQQAQDDEVAIAAGGYGGSCQTITQPGITRFDTDGRPVQSTMVPGSALAVDVALSEDERWLAIARPGGYLQGTTGTVQVMSASLLSVASDGGSDAGVAQDGGVSPRDGGVAPPFRAFDAGFPGLPGFPGLGTCGGGSVGGQDEQITAVAFDHAGTLYALSREPAQLTVYQVFANGNLSPVQVISLSERSMRDTGHELFHTDVGSGLACASCHGEALDDGHVWTFRDVGPRRTQNMRGGMLATLPLHWEGDMQDFEHLVAEVMTRRMGGFVVEPRYAQALGTWINAQPALRLEGRDSAAVARGRLLFESAEVGCATCHTGEALTNNQSVDVGTGGLLQVPSLRGLALRAPFMHDGCAATLKDRFGEACGGGDQHGKTSQLSEHEVADLVAYLETL